MRIFSPLLVWVLLAALAGAQEPLAILPSPGKVLGYAASGGPGRWIVFGPGGFRPVQPVVLAGGSSIVWEGEAGEYAVICLPPGDAQPIVAVVVLGKDTPPVPPPIPPPIPPDVPEGKYGIGPLAYQWATSVATNHRGAASQLADNYEAIAAGIAAGSWRTPQESNKELTGRNRAVLGVDGSPLLEAWRPWFVSWKQAVDQLIANGKLPVTVTEYRILYLETAAGLKAVK